MDLDLFDDTDDAPKNVRVGVRFQPKAKPRPLKKVTPLVSPLPQQVLTNVESHSDDQRNSGIVNGLSEHAVDSGPVINVHVPKKNEDSHALFEKSTRESSDIMIELESLTDILPDSPSSNVHVIQSVVDDDDDDSSCLLHNPDLASESRISLAEDLLSENEFIVIEPVPNQQDMPSGIMNQDSDSVLLPDLNSEALEEEEHIQTSPKVPGKLVARRAKSTKEDKTTSSDQSSRVLRKRQNRDNSLHHLIDEPEDDARVDEGLDIDSEFGSKNKPNKPPVEKEKPSRRRKKDNNSTDEATKKAPPKKKKFSHSTKRRKVDKSLLENPDSFDPKKVSLTNLIRLAEYKERSSKKNEATASQVLPPNPSTINNNPTRDNGFQEYDEGEDNNIAFDEAGYFDGEPVMAEENSGYFNYHTFMNKTRTPKWTDQDTELFYEGIQQFGTDFTMIQQLFPGRTRRQVKLKYKKEELKHPLRLREALMNRSKGHSHFDTVIERLKQMAEEEKKNGKDAEIDDVEGEDADEPEAKNGEEEDASAQIGVVDKQEGQGLPEDEATVIEEQAYDSEDELFKWSQYKSEL